MKEGFPSGNIRFASGVLIGTFITMAHQTTPLQNMTPAAETQGVTRATVNVPERFTVRHTRHDTFFWTVNTMTTIGASLLVTGEITSQEDITIHGRVKGQIRMEEGSLLVAPKGSVDADVEGTRVTIHGTLAGNVAAAERIELAPTADVSGMLTTCALIMHDGATFNGLVDVDRQTAKGAPRHKIGPATPALATKAS
jgi:cytoskeletal protein CcmA (bactofilin family)